MGKHRTTLEYSDKVMKRWRRLQQMTAATSRVEVLRRALAIYEKLLDERAAGTTIVLRREVSPGPHPVRTRRGAGVVACGICGRWRAFGPGESPDLEHAPDCRPRSFLVTCVVEKFVDHPQLPWWHVPPKDAT